MKGTLLDVALVLVLLVAGCGTTEGRVPLPDYAALPSRAEMPDPLAMLDGKPVKTRAQWEKERRPQLKEMFQHYMYGQIPPKPAKLEMNVIAEYHDFLGGMATLKLITLQAGPGNGPRIDLMLVVPNELRGPAPVLLAMDFCGNHAITDDPRVPLAKSWLWNRCPGCVDGVATEAARGTQSTNWPLAEIVGRGYALATFYSGDIDSDRKDVSSGIYKWLAARGQSSLLSARDPNKSAGLTPAPKPEDRGTLAAWAWGFSRCVDYLINDSSIDKNRIASVGHSRNGKTALLAAAFDERIAMAFPHQAGCGGSAPSRGKTGESVKAINDSFPHWFNAEFKKFNGTPERLPFDQNCLVALCAPRPVLFSCAEGDQWANPAGQFEVLKAAEPVYKFLGADGLGVTQAPGFRQLVGGRLGYYIREGKHSMTADDWSVFMDFADRQWKGK